MRLVIDINLSPEWVEVFHEHGYSAVHWSAVGNPRAPDTVIMAWAREHGNVVFAHDLDFSRLLPLTRASGPSVFQVRTEDVLPSGIGTLVIGALRQHREDLEAGAIVVLDATSSRARILPISPLSPGR
jgi:predicted nuclease of predicted toxin-antitoxin system